jgi:hypothetical protein
MLHSHLSALLGLLIGSCLQYARHGFHFGNVHLRPWLIAVAY